MFSDFDKDKDNSIKGRQKMTDHPTEHGVGSLQNTDNDLTTHATDIFAEPIKDTSMISGYTSIIRPVDKTDAGPFVFNIPSQGMSYLHLGSARIYMTLRVVRGDGQPITNAHDYVSMINSIGTTLWDQIGIEIGGTLIPELGNVHANYKAYLETVLSYSRDALESHCCANRFHMDEAGEYNDMGILVAIPAVAAADGNPAVAAIPARGTLNAGFANRRAILNDSIQFDVMSPIHSDFMAIDKVLPPGCPMTMILTRARDPFVLMSVQAGANFKLLIDDIKLHVRHITLAPELVAHHISMFGKRPSLYQINRTIMKTAAYAPGLTDISYSNAFTGILPKSIIIGLVPSQAFHGSYATNPFFFPHLNISEAYIRVNDRQVPSEPYAPNWATRRYIREYRSLFDNTGISNSDMGSIITPTQFSRGCTLFAFDLSPDMDFGRKLHPRESGKIDIQLHFREALPYAVNLLVFAMFDATVLIDKTNKVTIDAKPS